MCHCRKGVVQNRCVDETSGVNVPRPDLRVWWPGVLLGVLVAVLGLFDLTVRFGSLSQVSWDAWVGSLGCTIAAALFVRAPGTALLAFWVATAAMAVSSNHLTAAHLIPVLVGFGTARYGSRIVVWLSGLLIPAEAAVEVLVFHRDGYPLDTQINDPLRALDLGNRIDTVPHLVTGVIVFAVPWLLGLLLRSLEANEESQVRRAAAESRQHEAEARLAHAGEVADLRAAQARMAHDVHDVVGHSLAVILVQAESAQFLGDDQTEQIRETLRNVAASARGSLQDVRAVLSSSETASGTRSAGLDTLLDGVTVAGNDVRTAVFGTPQPLPPELDFVAFRVLREMLTNALRHGARGRPVSVERHWEDELRIEVRNAVADGPGLSPAGGQGVDGMRRRLESVGGRLDVRSRRDADETTFSATAWIPLRTVAT